MTRDEAFGEAYVALMLRRDRHSLVASTGTSPAARERAESTVTRCEQALAILRKETR